MFKNKGFEEKIQKYKKIHIYPKNTHFRGNENLTSINSKTDLKLKYNLTQLFLESNNYNNNSIKNKSFMNYINSKTSLNPYYNSIAQNNLESSINFLQRNKSSNNIFNKKNYFQNRHQKVIDELKLLQRNNNVTNNISNTINNNISNNLNNKNNFNFQKISINKSKSINYSAITSKKNLYDRIINRSLKANNYNKSFNNENNELTKKLDTLNNTLLFEQKIAKDKNKIKYDIEKKKITKLFNLEKLKKIKGFSADKIKIKNMPKKSDIIKSKLNKIKIFANKRNKSSPKKNAILRTCQNKIKNKYKLFIEQNYLDNLSINNTEFFSKNNTINNIEPNKTYNYNYSCDYTINKHKNRIIKNKVENIINDKYLKTTNVEPELNLNLNTINLYENNEGDNKIQEWIYKEKRNKNIIKKRLNDELFFEEKNSNKDFQNYKLSNKYFNNNTLFNNRKPFNSKNLGKYFDLELNRFNNKLNNFNHVKKARNIINSKHIFKPIY
jgi:hypothetical protein